MVHPFRLAVGLAATSLVLTGWTSSGAVVGATEPPAATETVRLAAVVDGNGAAPGGLDVTAVDVDPADAEALTEQLEERPDVLHVEVDSRVSIAQDPYESQQYSPGRVRADLVRSRATGDGVVVAVIDSGVLGSHADLSTPLPGGRARVLTGTTFLTPSAGQPNLTGTPGNVDPHGHGTHVAGIIAAARGNGIGIAGIAPDAQILPVRALDSLGYGWSSDVAAGILWAHQQGADVINLSLAGPVESDTVSAVIDSVTRDVSRGKGPSIVVAAAGNSGTSYPKVWPAAHPRAIAVASSDRSDNVAPSSSRGTYVDVAAPGVGILSACVPSGYCQRSGTSMASPLVAGVAALLRQQAPQLDGPTAETILEGSAHDIDRPGQDTASGWGRIDVARAFDPVTYPPVPRPVRLPTGSVDSLRADGRSIAIQGRVSDIDGNPIIHIESTVDGRRSVRERTATGGRFSLNWNDVPGTHRICVSALDAPTKSRVSLGCRNLVVK